MSCCCSPVGAPRVHAFLAYASWTMFSNLRDAFFNFKVSWNPGVVAGLVQKRLPVLWASVAQLCDPDSVTPTLWAPLHGGVPPFAGTKVPLFGSAAERPAWSLSASPRPLPRELPAHLSLPCIVLSWASVFPV